MNSLSKKQFISLVTPFFLMPFIFAASVLAVSVAEKFTAGENLAIGTIVSLGKNTDEVISATPDNMDNLYGVVVTGSDITVGEADNGQITVAKDGVVNAIVSTAGGDIKKDDPITVKTINGIGEKAVEGRKVIGIAQADFDSGTDGARKIDSNASSSQAEVYIGSIPIKISVGTYATEGGQADGSRNLVERLADNIAGKTVNPMTIVIAGAILVFGMFSAAFLVSSSGYASMVSIGRNPLSENKALNFYAKTVAVAFTLFGLSVLLSYAVVKIFA